MKPPRLILLLCLVALALLFAWWFRAELLARTVFALPPALCALGIWMQRRTAGFWSGVLALFWFSHGVMVAMTRPPERWLALAEILLALCIITAASLPGLRNRFAARRR